MSELEIWQEAIKIGRLIEKPDGELVVSQAVYDILGKPRRGIRDLETLAIQYRDLWPSGIKSGGHYVKSGISSIIGRLRRFKKNFPDYSTKDILDATLRYVTESRKENNYQFMKTAENFILKENTSMLETYCEVIKNNEVKPSTQSNIRVG